MAEHCNALSIYQYLHVGKIEFGNILYLNSPSGVGPVLTVRESDGPGVGVGPSHQLVGVIHNASGPEEPLGVLIAS